jgi:hypothetical protein
MLRRVTIMGLCFLLAGCGEQKLAGCLSQSEQSILMRQMALVPVAKQELDRCFQRNTVGYCRGLYRNANDLVAQCMKGAGYSYADGKCDGMTTKKESCHWPTYLVRHSSDFRN